MTTHDDFRLDRPECHLVECPACLELQSVHCELCDGTGEVLEVHLQAWEKEQKENNINF